jgi:RNA 2',3'-cyclic 3'-phosphodiesterase
VTLDELAQEQGVTPISDIAQLRGEPMDDFDTFFAATASARGKGLAGMSQNLYVAVLPSSEAVYDLRLACESSARGLMTQAASEGRFRPTPAEEWHITLAYLGDRETREVVTDLRVQLADVASHRAPFTLGLVAAGVFEGGVLWAGVGGARQSLIELANQARYRLGGDRTYPYMPHLTLAKADESVDLAPLVAAMADYRGPAWWVDRVHLMLSGSDGALDRSIASWPLTGRS